MLLGLNGATTMKANLVTDIQVAAQAGYDYLEIWTEKLDDFLQHNSIYKLKEMLDESNLKPLSVNSLDDFTFQPEAKFQEIQQRCAVLCERAMHLNCHCLVVCPSPLPSLEVTREEVKRETTEKLQILLRISKGYGVGLAFEFLGEPIYSVKDLAFCNEIVEEINDPSLGLVIDVFHFYIGGSTLDSIRRVDPKKLSIVHLNDAEDLPKDSLKDKHRLLPGEGILPLRDILSEIKRIGYQGPYSIELFRPEYWEWDHSRLAIEAKERMATILASLD
jgi:2-keto-myo-inositol isomerase